VFSVVKKRKGRGMKVKNVIIIGGGPAGISCAIQLTRYCIKASIIEKGNLGGLLLNANNVENYPGFPLGIKGAELVESMKEQLRRQKIEVLFEEVTRIDSNKDHFKVTTKKTSYYSRYVVVSSGTKPEKFKDCPIQDELAPKIFYEVYPISTIEGKKIVIVGAGDAAFDYALNLVGSNEVVILNRNETSNCIPVLLKRVEESKKIEYIKKIKIQKIFSSPENMITLRCKTSEGSRNIEADYLLFAIGRVPSCGFLSPELKREIHKKKENSRIYLAGDVKNGIFRQTAIAVGDGIVTAMKIYKKIKKEEK
jgi:thioredoxin reductase (NADPH)